LERPLRKGSRSRRIALCKDADLVTAAIKTYRQARAISSNLGILRGALHDLNSLAKADPKGLLKPVRAVFASKKMLPHRHAGDKKDTGEGGEVTFASGIRA
jgi:hypothetical protein